MELTVDLVACRKCGLPKRPDKDFYKGHRQVNAKVAYWGDRCWMCGTSEWTDLDHVKPLAKGGPHILANLRPACRSCNASKSATWPLERVV